ncbi:sensor histidine kinase [Haloarcula litorea]|uniref:sensor histidine kinase n=1 Tax=Haloarcula litorea TaxID=3032579 RepID=UPI0023E7F009|nr:HAMP domain-containing sensor histidine kinase [Halomicroarcula sp. GDY20]
MESGWSSTGVPESLTAPLRRVSSLLPASELGGPVLLAGLGLGHAAVAVWNAARELSRFGIELGPAIAFVLVAGPGVGLCLAGARLSSSPLDTDDRWLVGWSATGGAVLLGTIVYLSMLVRLAEGRPISEPVFVLGMTSGMGGVAGAAVGTLYARALRAANEAEQRRTQLELLSSVFRHDVLNSMIIIRGRADVLAEEAEGREREFAESIHEHSQTVIELAERVKDVIATISDSGALELTPTRLEPIVERQLAPFRSSHDDVRFETDVDDVAVLADDILEEVVGNLLDNAVEHGTDGGGDVISVTTERRDGRVRLRIADTGPGVPDELKDRLFERGTSETGSGFGLFFVATMVDHYGGDVWVEDADDGGAAFVVELDAA